MKKTLFAIALIASLTAGAALQANGKPAKKPAKKQWYRQPTIVPTKPITDPKKLNRQIRDIQGKIRKDIRGRDGFVNDRTRSANKGNQKQVQKITDEIRTKDAQIVKHRALLRMYTMRLMMIRLKEKAKEKAKEAKKKVAKKVKVKSKKIKPVKKEKVKTKKSK